MTPALTDADRVALRKILGEQFTVLQAELYAAGLAACMERVGKDAERYRWLRDDLRRFHGPIWCVTWRHGWPDDPRSQTNDLFGKDLDATIDAAIRAGEKP